MSKFHPNRGNATQELLTLGSGRFRMNDLAFLMGQRESERERATVCSCHWRGMVGLSHCSLRV